MLSKTVSNRVLFIVSFTVLLLFRTDILAQNKDTITWWNPINSEYPVVNGNGWTDELSSIYHRLPQDAESQVRKPVWELSKHSAGLSIRFWTNTKNIHVQYKLNGEIDMPHMPATGVSGLDLYKKTENGEWQRLWGTYSLDSISNYIFKNGDASTFYKNNGAEYQLFLPLYNEVKELSIGIDNKSNLKAIPRRKEKPIVVYGTSIAQGACASRPGMAWTNILERRLERPIINLGFSGNGKLDTEVLKLMSGIDAKAFILDCLPNLSIIDNPFLLTVNAVTILKEKYPNTPVILVAHPGYANTSNIERNNSVAKLNEDLQSAFALSKSLGHKRVYLLSKEDLNLQFDSFVDNIHPNDIGMQEYANVYEKFLRSILRESKGVLTTTIPKTQYRDTNVYNWEQRHQEILELNKTNPPKICLFGDSIIHFWGGEPEASIARGQESWEVLTKNDTIRNFGFGWDRIENVLWRVHHDELDGFNADKIIIMLGTNNLHLNSENDILDGLKKLIDNIKYRQPKSEILLLGVLPRAGKERQVSQLNMKMGMFALGNNIEFNHLGNVLLTEGNNKVNDSLFVDGLHPNKTGYELISTALRNILEGNTNAEGVKE